MTVSLGTEEWRLLDCSVKLNGNYQGTNIFNSCLQMTCPNNLCKQTLGTPQLLGLYSSSGLLHTALLPLLMTATLFTGPILFKASAHFQSDREHKRIGRLQFGIYTLRDCVVAPISEEWCFRSCMVPLLWLQGVKPSTIIATVPLFFGLGHLHHGWELMVAHKWAAHRALQVVCFQFLYTTVFGWYAAWLFITTGTVAAPVLAHALCNTLGVPPFAQMANHRRASWLMVATVAGMLGFALLVGWMTVHQDRFGSLYHQQFHQH
eukprot:GHRR01021738.1.p1 GENE.GHRR01021738.1~~GHRR01021738.1.p1  ORF type:complete len:263 (+),score=46.33 GHRR01021738.1:695-1483(+)